MVRRYELSSMTDFIVPGGIADIPLFFGFNGYCSKPKILK